MKAIAPKGARIPNGRVSLLLWINTSAKPSATGFRDTRTGKVPAHSVIRRFPCRQFTNRQSSIVCRSRQRGATGCPGGRPPEESVKAAPMRASRLPFEALAAATRATVARIGHRVDGAVQPIAHRLARAVLGLFEAGHQQAQARRRAGKTVFPAEARR